MEVGSAPHASLRSLEADIMGAEEWVSLVALKLQGRASDWLIWSQSKLFITLNSVISK